MDHSSLNQILDRFLNLPDTILKPFRVYLKAKQLVQQAGVSAIEKDLEQATKDFRSLYKTWLYKQTVGDTRDLWLYQKRLQTNEEQIDILLSAIKFAEHQRIRQIKRELFDQYQDSI